VDNKKHCDYRWTHKDTRITATSIKGILHERGFNASAAFTKRRVPCVIFVNLKTKCSNWLGSAGKTHIELTPYEDKIAKIVSSLAYKIPSYHGKGPKARLVSVGRYQEAKRYLVNFLYERKRAIDVNPSLRITDRITQSGVWYRIRPKMIDAGFEPPNDWGTTRTTLTGQINKFCDELFGCSREDLGIIASARAEMIFEGQYYPVNIDSVKELAQKGIVIIIIEKEGIADLLKDYAKDYENPELYISGIHADNGH
jgi:hypothetical protein